MRKERDFPFCNCIHCNLRDHEDKRESGGGGCEREKKKRYVTEEERQDGGGERKRDFHMRARVTRYSCGGTLQSDAGLFILI